MSKKLTHAWMKQQLKGLSKLIIVAAVYNLDLNVTPMNFLQTSKKLARAWKKQQ